ncbi:MAG: hypothetical protein J6T56_08675 [Bacteroidales bacterium]|nr:hypothetical protein [Bacteroidales bacterium]MBP5613942.1 hypothetical protein [Bacteroidales bacterium]
METDAKKKEKYISPQMEMQRFALEKGFAVSEDEAAATQTYEQDDLSNGWNSSTDYSWF